MSAAIEPREGVAHPFPEERDSVQRYVDWFHELDAWTEYWDIYHPETRGRYYFGDGKTEGGLLTRFLPRERTPEPFVAWTRMALGMGLAAHFAEQVRVPEVAEAVMEVDALLDRLFATSFGDAADQRVHQHYPQWRFPFRHRHPPARH